LHSLRWPRAGTGSERTRAQAFFGYWGWPYASYYDAFPYWYDYAYDNPYAYPYSSSYGWYLDVKNLRNNGSRSFRSRFRLHRDENKPSFTAKANDGSEGTLRGALYLPVALRTAPRRSFA
jgi:hypothetical protein